MRVLFVTPTLGQGGAERLTVKAALGMERRGLTVAVTFGFLDLQAEPLRDAGIELYMRKKAPLGPYKGPGEAPSIRTWFSSMRHIRRTVQAFRPDVIYAQSVASAFAARVAAPRVPLLVTVHGISHTDERLASLLFRFANARLTAVSEASAAGLRRYPWAPAVEVLSPGVDSDHVRADSLLEKIAPVGKPNICVVARHELVKGVDVMLRALPAVARQFPDVGLTLVGHGEQLANHRRLAEDLGVSEHVWFVGLVPNAAPYMAVSDVVVLPSRREGLPVVALEALSLDRPVVATRVGGTPSVVIDGETGWVVPPEDDAALAAAIVACFSNPEEAARRARTGRHLVEERFDIERMHDRTAALLLELAKPRSRRKTA